MLETNITEGANILIWIVCLSIGFLSGLIAIDSYVPKKKEEKKEIVK